MTDIVERLRGKVPMAWEDEGFMIADEDAILATFKEAAAEIERLREAANDLAQYVSRADWYHYVKPETRAALGEKE